MLCGHHGKDKEVSVGSGREDVSVVEAGDEGGDAAVVVIVDIQHPVIGQTGQICLVQVRLAVILIFVFFGFHGLYSYDAILHTQDGVLAIVSVRREEEDEGGSGKRWQMNIAIIIGGMSG